MKSTTYFVHSSCRHWLWSEGTGVKVLGNPTLEKAVVLALPVALLLGFSIVRAARARTLSALLQLLGAGCLLVVVLTHVAEALHILPSMGWGEPHSIGHYADLASALLGITLLLAAFVAAPGAKWWAHLVGALRAHPHKH